MNGTGPENPGVTQPYGTPDASLVVFAGDRTHRYAARLNRVPDGTSVIAAGTVEDVRMYGTPDEPRAVFTLIASDGGATYAAVGTATYDEIFGYLVAGDEVSLVGLAVRSFEDDPRTTYIRVTQVEPLTD
ncbi:hypothetical protein PV378_13660 [Streptomyces scabiei]|uniref:hypothetical protein n=1 Tax=Streptomyces scabiei TaxID=1930 RepID=UPI0029BF2B62|nr:hypothetical protein [Streptomyces scabiei]MDX3047540.1 hypothetical protein [Streptomyces scabiei]